jgi:DNA (cytosine-5)-methyltransferase 1
MSTTGASMARGSSRQDYATPPDFMAACVKRFGPIAFDLAASAENTKAPRFFSIEQNSLVQPWHEIEGLLWLNPPFNDIAPWAKKCSEEMRLGARILFLTPASVGSNWFRDFTDGHARVLALNGRICFDGIAPYPKDCICSVYGLETGFEVWSWKK